MIRLFCLLTIALTLAACATAPAPAALAAPTVYVAPALETDALVMNDGARLPLTRWGSTSGQAPWVVVVALHGVNDSRASFRLAAAWWAEQGVETWAFDQRGFGDAPDRGRWAGETRMVQDLRDVVDLVRATHPGALVAVAGESMGGAVGIAAFGSERPPRADRLVLLAPAVWGWSSQSPLNRYSLRLAARLMGERTIRPPAWIARDRMASDNSLELYRTGRDPAAILGTRYDALEGLVDLMESASVRLGSVSAPTLLAYGGHDHLVPKAAMRRALRRAGQPPGLRQAYYPEGGHILNRDLQAEAVYADVLAWLRDPSAPLPSGAGSIGAALEPSKPR